MRDYFSLVRMNHATHFDRSKWNFNFLRGLAPQLYLQAFWMLDGFSIEWHETESIDLFAAKFESGAMRFSGKKSLRRWSPFKTRIPPLSFYYKEQ